MKKLIVFAVIITVLTSAANAQFSQCTNSDMQNFFMNAIGKGDTLKIKQYMELGIPINGTFCTTYVSSVGYYGAQDADYYYPPDLKGQYPNENLSARIPYILAVLFTGNEEVIDFFIRNKANVNQFFQIPEYGKSKFDPVSVLHGIRVIGSRQVSPVGVLFMNVTRGNNDEARKSIDILMNKYAGILKLKLTPDDMEWMNRNVRSSNNWPYVCEKLEIIVGSPLNYDVEFLYQSIKKKNTKNIDYCLNVKNIQPDARCMVAAFSEAGNIDLAKRFIDMGIPLESYHQGTTILGHAINAKKIDFVQYLVEKGANINATITQEDGKTMRLIDLAKKVRAGDDLIEYLIIAQAKQNR